jgi:hypothetical protein
VEQVDNRLDSENPIKELEMWTVDWLVCIGKVCPQKDDFFQGGIRFNEGGRRPWLGV